MPSYQVPRVQIVPQADDQVSFHVEGKERLRWNAARRYPRPFFFPVIGPSGQSLTRMGHPAAPDHDHHRSLWLGHHNVGGVNFWEERGGTQQIRQERWVHYQDGQDEGGMVVELGWFDAHNVRLLKQQLIAVLRPLEQNETWFELQLTFTPVMDGLELAKTNFGFMGLRVAKDLSIHYGGGQLSNSEGSTGEPDLFAKPARWVDYSGPIATDVIEGITWFDHPSNPGHPTSWHVRADGWMSAAFNLREALRLKVKEPLVLRYGFHVHRGGHDAKVAGTRAKGFAATTAWAVVAAQRPWRVHLQRS
ncbi:MAG: PmoA family protein [Gemmataceae bacterium]